MTYVLDGWSVGLADRNSTEPVSNTICKSIAGKKVVSANSAFALSKSSSIDLSGVDTSGITDISFMFYDASSTGYVKNAATTAKFNDSSVTNIPSTLVFTVK